MQGTQCRKMLNNPVLTSGYKTAEYRAFFKKTWGYEVDHFGYDMVDSGGIANVFAPCACTIIASGTDSVLGGCIVAKLHNVCTLDGNCYFESLIIRLNHLSTILKRNGDYVEAGEIIAKYGNTGKYTTGAHLHIEVDFDHVYPLYTPTLSSNSSMFYGTKSGAHDHTMFSPGRIIPMK